MSIGNATIRAGATAMSRPSRQEVPVKTSRARRLGRASDERVPVKTSPSRRLGRTLAALPLSGAPASVGAQGYQLVSTASSVTVRASTADGLFAGVQTLRQLLPGRVESPSAQPGPWSIPGATILDYPRFAYRGAMLDVA